MWYQQVWCFIPEIIYARLRNFNLPSKLFYNMRKFEGSSGFGIKVKNF